MAAKEPAKAPPLYEPDGGKSTAPARGPPHGLAAPRGHAKSAGMTRALLALGLLLTACHSQETRDKIEAMQKAEANAGTPASSPAPGAAAFSVDENSDLLQFSYAWPAEAAAIPALAARFRKEMERAHKEAVDTAREDQAMRKGTGLDYHQQSFSRHWASAGQSDALLSLVGTTSFYTGGAHPNHGSNALLWDRKAGREIRLDQLFAGPQAFAGFVTAPWCAGIKRARAERLEGEQPDDGVFGKCPQLRELSIVPSDEDGDGRFDRLRFLADPYVAGAYAEGDYEVDFAIDPAWIAAMKPEWRSSFEAAQPPQ